MDEERLARYLAGEASAAERAEVETWKVANPANQVELARLEAVWTDVAPAGTWNVDGAWAKVAGRLDRGADGAEDIAVFPLPQRPWMRWVAAAAAVLVVATGGFLISRPGKPVEYVTAIGEQRTVILPDGSQVTLAPASHLAVEPQYAKPNRSIRLTGRAWFVVGHDPLKPFRVTTSAGVVEDLGTEFEVNASGDGLRVAVASGTVAVHREGEPPVTLGAGDLAMVALQGSPTVSHQIAVERITSWRGGTLDFDDRPLVEVTAELERWYDIKFTLDGGAGDRRFSGPIPTDRLDQALAIVATAFPEMTVGRSGRAVTIAPKRSP